jgi:hypothetical protein
MELRPLGSQGMTGASDPAKVPTIRSSGTATGQPVPEVRVSDAVSLLNAIAAEDMEQLLTILEPTMEQGTATRVAEMVQALVGRARESDVKDVGGMVREIAEAAPQTAGTLAEREDLAPLRAEITSTLTRLTMSAKVNAEHEIAAAGERVADLSKPVGTWHSEPRAMLDLCEKLVAGGGLVNYKKAERLASSLRADVVVPVDVPDPFRVTDARGLRLRAVRHFDFLEHGPTLLGILLLVILLAVVWVWWLR